MKSVFLGIVLVISGCATTVPWQAKVLTDEFSDRSICRVAQYPSAFTAGYQSELRRQLYGSSISHHLIAEMREDGPRIGVISSHNLLIIGDLQIRVDEHETVTISAKESPVDVGGSDFKMPDVPGLSDEQRKSIEDSIRGISGFASPYRMATGEKAETLLMQISSGREVKFRTVGVNAAASIVGVVPITDELRTALRECGLVAE